MAPVGYSLDSLIRVCVCVRSVTLFQFNFNLVPLPDLIHRAILISGSALSPWAIQRDPLSVKKKVATDTGCHGDLLDDDIAPCLRKKTIAELLAIKLDPPR
jgi:Carboxylesterase family